MTIEHATRLLVAALYLAAAGMAIAAYVASRQYPT